MLVCRAPTHPPKTGPTPKNYCLSKNFFLKKKLFSNSVIKPVFKIIESCILIEERSQRPLLYAFLPYIQHFGPLKVIVSKEGHNIMLNF